MSSFKKLTNQKSIPGTRTSLQNGNIITSSGNPSLDHILGGGIPIGSILLIEEDKFSTYSRVLAKYFLAEGICSGHSIFIGSLDDDTDELIKNLPKPIEESTTLSTDSTQNSPTNNNNLNTEINEMKIAWRYQNLPKVNSEQSTKIGHNFNLLEKIDKDLLQSADIHYWNNRKCEKTIFKNLSFTNYLQELNEIIYKSKNQKDNSVEKTLLRICITSLGSPLWYEENLIEDFIKFLTIFKSIIRNNLCVGFITIPTFLIANLDKNAICRIRNLVDFSIKLESFAGSDKETNPAFKEYNGLLTLEKISALNSLAIFFPETTDLAFKLRRKKFVIEKLHLPPELQENDYQPGGNIMPSMSCASGTSNLDF